MAPVAVTLPPPTGGMLPPATDKLPSDEQETLPPAAGKWVQRGLAQVEGDHFLRARVCLDIGVYKDAGSCAYVADQCMELQAPRMAKRYYKKALEQEAPPLRTSAQYMALGGCYASLAQNTSLQGNAEHLLVKAVDAYTRAMERPAPPPMCHGLHLDTLLDLLAVRLKAQSWKALVANIEQSRPPTARADDEVLSAAMFEAGYATFRIDASPDNVRLLGTLLLFRGGHRTRQVVNKEVLPRLARLAIRPPSVACHLQALRAIRSAATHDAYTTWAFDQVSRFVERQSLTFQTMPAFLEICDVLAERREWRIHVARQISDAVEILEDRKLAFAIRDRALPKMTDDDEALDAENAPDAEDAVMTFAVS